jgi:7-carboxy-7-deazaguanine synthase
MFPNAIDRDLTTPTLVTMNQQSAIVARNSDPDHISVFKIFSTIQGEGPFTGRPAIFIRLFGCNLQCPWCDTDYTSNNELMETGEVIRTAVGMLPLSMRCTPLAVITGGEPFRQNLSALVRELRDWKFDVQIETNGTLEPDSASAYLATIVCSPKAPKVHPVIAKRAGHWKYVLDADHVDPVDGLPGETLGGNGCRYCSKR